MQPLSTLLLKLNERIQPQLQVGFKIMSTIFIEHFKQKIVYIIRKLVWFLFNYIRYFVEPSPATSPGTPTETTNGTSSTETTAKIKLTEPTGTYTTIGKSDVFVENFENIVKIIRIVKWLKFSEPATTNTSGLCSLANCQSNPGQDNSSI